MVTQDSSQRAHFVWKAVKFSGYCLLLFIVWRGRSRHEARVISAAKIVVKDSRGELLDVGEDSFTIENPYFHYIKVIRCSNGVYWLPETFAWIRGSIGDPCVWTEIHISRDGYRSSYAKTGLCTGMLIPDRRLSPDLVTFILAESDSGEYSTVDIEPGSMIYPDSAK